MINIIKNSTEFCDIFSFQKLITLYWSNIHLKLFMSKNWQLNKIFENNN